MVSIAEFITKKQPLKGMGLVIVPQRYDTTSLPKQMDVLAKPKKNQLFQLRGIQEESLDYIIDCENQLNTKFYPIVLLEYFYRLKVSGLLFIVVRPHIESELIECKGRIAIFLRNKYRILSETPVQEGMLLILQKRIANEYKERGIDNWTFGIVTGGGREEWIEQQIKAIVRQQVPSFEIIICGKSKPRKESHIRYISSDEERITKKKNIIAQAARYENIIIMHDRVLLDKNWFTGMKKFGNMWDTVACQIRHRGLRCYDWTSAGTTRIHWSTAFLDSALLRYDDWDPYATVMGSAHIFKRSAWKKVQFNEGMYYPDFEDRLFCNEMMFSGCFLRCNPYSVCHRFTPTTIVRREHVFNAKRLGRITAPTYNELVVYHIYRLLLETGTLGFFLRHWKEKIYSIASKLTVK